MLGPYIKSRGTRGTKMSANADPITVETYVQQGETIWKRFLSLNPKYEKIILFFIFGGSWGGRTSNPGERKFQGTKTS